MSDPASLDRTSTEKLTSAPTPLFRSQISDALSIRIARTDIVSASFFRRHCEFALEISEGGSRLTSVCKRFSEFVDLHNALSSAITISDTPLPELPPKKVFGNLEPPFVDERRAALEGYLQALLLHPVVPTSDIFWHFLDADDGLIVIARFLGAIPNEMTALARLAQLQVLLRSEAEAPRLSNALVLERLVKLAALQHPILLLRLCLTLTTLVMMAGGSREPLGRLGVLVTLLQLLEQRRYDPSLMFAAQEFCTSYTHVYPQGLLAVFQSQQGGACILRILRNPLLTEIHASIALLLWMGVDLPEIQVALAEADSLGMDILGALYCSSNSTARLLCGLVVTVLTVRDRFSSTDLSLPAARSVNALPYQLQDASCRRRRLTLPFEHVGDQQQNDERHMTATPTSLRPTTAVTAVRQASQCHSLTSTQITVFSFEEFRALIYRAAQSHPFRRLSGCTKDVIAQHTGGCRDDVQPYNRAIPTPGLRTPVVSSEPLHQEYSFPLQDCPVSCIWDPLVQLRQDYNASVMSRARQPHVSPASWEELDFVILYYACCSSSASAERLMSLLRQSLRGYRQNYNAEIDTSPFLLWVISLLVAQTCHEHPRGLLTHEDFSQLNQPGLFAATRNVASTGGGDWLFQRGTTPGAPWLSSNQILTASPTACGNGVDSAGRTCKPDDELLSGVLDDDDLSKAAQNGTTGSVLLWGPMRSLHQHVSTRLKATNVTGTWSPTASAATETIKKASFRDVKVTATDSTSVSEESSDIRQILSVSPFHLRPHLNYDINAINRHLVGIYKLSMLPPWERLARVRDFYMLLEQCLVEHPSPDARVFAAAVLLEMPWLTVQRTSPGTPPESFPCTHGSQLRQRQRQQQDGVQLHETLVGLFDSSSDLPSLGTTAATEESRSDPKKRGSMEKKSTSRKSLVPTLEFVVPQRVLKQRLQAGRALLGFGELVCEAQRDAVKTEDGILQHKETSAAARQKQLLLRDAALEDFAAHLHQYSLTVQMLQLTSTIARSFLSDTRAREEALRVARNGLAVQADALEGELQRLTSDTCRVFDLRDRTMASELQFREARHATDVLLKQLVGLNGELRKTQESLKESTRVAQRLRDRWMELEQQIAEVPQRRKQLAAQLSTKEKQEAAAVKDLQELDSGLSELQVHAKQQALDGERVASHVRKVKTILHLLEAWARKAQISFEKQQPSASFLHRRSSSSSEEFQTTDSERTLSRDEGEVQPLQLMEISAEDHPEALQYFLDQLASLVEVVQPEILRILHDDPGPATSWVPMLHSILIQCLIQLDHSTRLDPSELEVRVRTLSERRRIVEAELKKRRAESQQLKQALAVHGDTKSMIDRSSQLQVQVRASDDEVQKLTAAADQFETRIKAVEAEIEKKKAAARSLEGEFLSLRETYVQAIESSNATRQRLGVDILKFEVKLAHFLSDVSSAQEDRMYTPLNRLLLQYTLDEEVKAREELKVQIQHLTELLNTTTRVLSGIEDGIVSDTPPSSTHQFCHAYDSNSDT